MLWRALLLYLVDLEPTETPFPKPVVILLQSCVHIILIIIFGDGLMKMIVIVANKNTMCFFWLSVFGKKNELLKCCFSLKKKYLAYINNIVFYPSL